MEKIAFLGLGHMGEPMARQLVAARLPLTLWNRTPAKADALAAEARAEVEAEAEAARGTGTVTVAASPTEAVRDADVVITMLAGPDAVREVADAILPALRPGAYWVEMSTIGPDTVKELAELVPEGVTLVDAPVMGSTDKAAAGRLGVLAGGDAAGVEHVLARFGPVTRTGPLGSGAALKLVVNTAVIGGVALVAEAMRLADALGLDEGTARSALAAGPLAGAVARAFATDVHFGSDLAVKDVSLATRTTQLPAMEAVLGHFRAAAADPDVVHEDIARAVTHIRTRDLTHRDS
ncbi:MULTISPECIES: NAD(P)-dependent oxidoreductase [unclassified Streptomyces]|uniref:NAD(P)-dependent oxidoreductase n=1 Tax=unclassified Streptomyces TaxID=2593676 RepID=UPI00136F32CF|nr:MULTISPECIES: NAD(P)-dependent oxidoreductase [unclassified Streptomyces]NEA00902.1 NAD(P)-dependent oxidoreductase [Streptomyces sp. SID10116]MYY85785.1 NAD(P)-binding domain-containing protein [Streptomyces sp. SID335]MYZ17860.1 NAD(P)-binding domain-containing protein [Streptomyces sp. SID337]NDZ90134.1 NAD(P)-dependent oxidoreductase [Streptomyces sp. SID10115]NEB44955.1 NAD(P)-dependent oxidoreductase [Streptomyces sp. SID339]